MDKMYKNDELSLDELVQVTKDFIKLADRLYSKGKITEAEYDELTFVKKRFFNTSSSGKTKYRVLLRGKGALLTLLLFLYHMRRFDLKIS